MNLWLIANAKFAGVNICAHFPTAQNFLDPQLTSDGKPFGPIRFRQIIKERYLISKHINTSYNDIGKITPTERLSLLQCIKDDLEMQQKERDKLKDKLNTK